MGHYSRHLHALTQESAGTYRERKRARRQVDLDKAVSFFGEMMRSLSERTSMWDAIKAAQKDKA